MTEYIDFGLPDFVDFLFHRKSDLFSTAYFFYSFSLTVIYFFQLTKTNMLHSIPCKHSLLTLLMKLQLEGLHFRVYLKASQLATCPVSSVRLTYVRNVGKNSVCQYTRNLTLCKNPKQVMFHTFSLLIQLKQACVISLVYQNNGSDEHNSFNNVIIHCVSDVNSDLKYNNVSTIRLLGGGGATHWR